MRIVGLSQRGRRILGTMVGVAALAALVVPAAEASGPAFKPAMLNVTGWELASPSAGAASSLSQIESPAAGDGIGPGSYLLIDRSDGDFICTANFVWEGSDKRTYLGAAGHCFLPKGVAYEAAPAATVRVCTANCAFGGQTGSLAELLRVGTFQSLGPVKFARQSQGGIDVGNDFGIVEIPTGLAGLIRHRVPVWGGPITSSAHTPTLGDQVCLYGNAGGLGEVFATKARFGIGGFSGTDPWYTSILSAPGAWYATIPSAPGDSGAAVVNCPSLTGTSPAGILTHLATNGSGVIAGTTVARAIAMASSVGITLVP